MILHRHFRQPQLSGYLVHGISLCLHPQNLPCGIGKCDFSLRFCSEISRVHLRHPFSFFQHLSVKAWIGPVYLFPAFFQKGQPQTSLFCQYPDKMIGFSFADSLLQQILPLFPIHLITGHCRTYIRIESTLLLAVTLSLIHI